LSANCAGRGTDKNCQNQPNTQSSYFSVKRPHF